MRNETFRARQAATAVAFSQSATRRVQPGNRGARRRYADRAPKMRSPPLLRRADVDEGRLVVDATGGEWRHLYLVVGGWRQSSNGRGAALYQLSRQSRFARVVNFTEYQKGRIALGGFPGQRDAVRGRRRFGKAGQRRRRAAGVDREQGKIKRQIIGVERSPSGRIVVEIACIEAAGTVNEGGAVGSIEDIVARRMGLDPSPHTASAWPPSLARTMMGQDPSYDMLRSNTAARQFPARPDVMARVAVRNPFQIILVLRLRLPEIAGVGNLGHHAAGP